jgi:hypothetical protein
MTSRRRKGRERDPRSVPFSVLSEVSLANAFTSLTST